MYETVLDCLQSLACERDHMPTVAGAWISVIVRYILRLRQRREVQGIEVERMRER